MVRVLNVAEKNDAAKSIAEIMSRGGFRRRDGRSVYNKIYEFNYNIFNQNCQMIMTSVSGHLLNIEFTGAYKSWQLCNPVVLFEAPIVTQCLPDYEGIKLTLESEVRSCQYLIIWTDGDREGENIGFEIIEVCKKVKPNIQVFRARFSEITPQAIARACSNLVPPDQRMSDAVNVRRELDLRIGAAFTRFQTLRLKKVFPGVLANQLISYGSCQFPTLGFVVERYKQVQAFIPEAFWKLRVTHKKDDITTDFTWKRGRLFDHTACLVLYQICLEHCFAKVIDVKSRNKNKWRPQPLDTVEFEKLASRKLRINAKEAMTIAEKLYTKGYISYPRTETNIFPKELNLTSLVEQQLEDPNWGAFAQRVLEWGPNPRQGNKTDNAHPPIHPTKYVDTLQGKDKAVYELIVRHFLACVSKDAEGRETTVEIDINNERFAVNGLMITARNYLDVYPYDKWNAKIIGEYSLNEIFEPSAVEMDEGETTAPNLLTEADLIGLMEKHGIGTDATHAEHIETIKSRLYVGLNEGGRFIPGELGMGLVEGYDLMGLHLSKPNLRAELEADLKRISEGTRDPKVVLREQIAKYKEYFLEIVRQAVKLDSALAVYFNVTPDTIVEENNSPQLLPIMKCPKCQCGDIVLRTKKDNKGFFLSCLSYPNCNAVMWLPESLEQISVTENDCTHCRPRAVKKIKLKFKAGTLMPFYPDELITCLGGCEPELMDIMGTRPILPSRNSNTDSSSGSRNASSDSGYESANHGFSRTNSNLSSGSARSQSATNIFLSRSNSNPSSGSSRSQSTSNNTFQRSNNILDSTTTNSRQMSTNHPVPRNPFRPVSTANNRFDSSNDIVCNCGKKAIVLVVKKDGPTKGRQFYKCPEISEGSKCDFFLWKNEDSSVPQTKKRFNSDSIQNENSENGILCRCNLTAKIMIVRKEGPTKGRQFYTCPKGRDEGCKFFKWADEESSNRDTSSNFGSFTHSSAGPSNRRSANSEAGGPPNKRKCGLCSQRGHNRKKCPQNR
ncbi:DNA topoisomerase 3-alpha [Trichonephila clavata]|uniref:DNA topoisomerase n=1 Tax=Trichonephila clavata TaxID=2740835 RepID=A0A8X6LVM9_TRICU|nr:DNA topoisomerase 3-alpha [Trichonephila clavata]